MTARPRPAARAIADAPLWLVLSWTGAALFALWLTGLVLARSWPELRMAACFFLPLQAVLLLRHGLPSLLLAIITACSLVSAAGWALDWYSLHWWFDVLLHGLNPFAITAASMVMFWKAELSPSAARAGRFVASATVYGLLLGAAWELFELTYLVLTWPDTLLDLVMDGAGAALGGWFALWLVRCRGEAPAGHRRLAGLRTSRASGRGAAVAVRVRR